MKSIDYDSLSKLQKIYNRTSYIHMTKTFDLKEKGAGNKTNAADPSV